MIKHIPVTKIDPKTGEKYTVECEGCKYERYESYGWPMECCPRAPHTCLIVEENGT